MFNINNYMTPEEAVLLWGIPPETMKNKTIFHMRPPRIFIEIANPLV